MDWAQIGTNAGLVAGGIVAYFAGRGKRQVGQAADQAAVSEYKADATVSDAAAAQIKGLLDRVQSLEERYSALWDSLQKEKAATSRLRDRVRQLEGILRGNSIPVPPEPTDDASP